MKRKLVIFALLLLIPLGVWASIFTGVTLEGVRTSVPMFQFTITTAGEDDSFTLPIYNGGTYRFGVDWGDNSADLITAYDDAAVTHTYEDSGATTYTISITGTITGFRFANVGDKLLMRDIKSWGSLNLGNNEDYFKGCINLTVSATDILDLTGTTSLYHAFYQAAITTIPSILNWAFSNVTDMESMFQACSSYNQDLLTLDTSSVTNMWRVFSGATSFDQNIGSWDITSMTVATDFLLGVTLSTANYSALLVGWEAQNPNNTVTFHGGNSLYDAAPSAAATARAHLILAVGSGGHSWTITDGGEAP